MKLLREFALVQITFRCFCLINPVMTIRERIFFGGSKPLFICLQSENYLIFFVKGSIHKNRIWTKIGDCKFCIL